MSDETAERIAAPTEGDVFSEVYAYWVVVVSVKTSGVTVLEFSGHPSNPTRMKLRHFDGAAAMATAYGYKGGSGGFWVSYSRRASPEQVEEWLGMATVIARVL